MKFTQIHSSQNLKNPPKMDLDIDHPNLPSSTHCASPALHREDPLQSHPFESNLLFLRLNPFSPGLWKGSSRIAGNCLLKHLDTKWHQVFRWKDLAVFVSDPCALARISGYVKTVATIWRMTVPKNCRNRQPPGKNRLCEGYARRINTFNVPRSSRPLTWQ